MKQGTTRETMTELLNRVRRSPNRAAEIIVDALAGILLVAKAADMPREQAHRMVDHVYNCTPDETDRIYPGDAGEDEPQ